MLIFVAFCQNGILRWIHSQRLSCKTHLPLSKSTATLPAGTFTIQSIKIIAKIKIHNHVNKLFELKFVILFWLKLKLLKKLSHWFFTNILQSFAFWNFQNKSEKSFLSPDFFSIEVNTKKNIIGKISIIKCGQNIIIKAITTNIIGFIFFTKILLKL